MVFTHPLALWLLLGIVPLVALHVRHRSGMRAGRVGIVAFVRCLAYALLVLALAQPLVERGDQGRTVVAVVDVSKSIRDTDLDRIGTSLAELRESLRPEESFRLVVFDRHPRELNVDKLSSEPGAISSRLRSDADGAESSGSAVASALELAGALIRHEGRGRIVLYTDGLQTGGDALAATLRLAERGIAVEVSAVGEVRANEVVLRSVSMPAFAAVGSTITLTAEIESSVSTPAWLRVHRNESDEEIVREVLLQPGIQSVTCTCPLNHEGTTSYTVNVTADVDTLADNNELAAAVQVGPARNVRVVEDDENAPATAAFGELLGVSADVRQLLPEALSAADALENTDLLVIADTPAEAIGAESQQRLKKAVVDGLGLLVTGGRRAYGPGGYADSPLAEVLPLRFAQEVEHRDPSTALVVIIDTSGSMGGSRVNLAKEIARLAIARLKPHDKVGIVEFYGSKRWAAPIQSAANAIDLQRALNRLSAGGGTVILPAIEEAYYALKETRARTKHVLVLTDGGVESGAFEPLIRKISDNGMTLSTVLVGPGRHSSFLARLAQWGRGRFYTAPDRFNLPEIIIKQPKTSLLSPLVEQPASLVRKCDDPLFDGLDLATAPQITGYVRTQSRPTADLLVASDQGHPILARWRYGLGEVAALTTQVAGDWTEGLSEWPSYAVLVSNLARSLEGVRPSEALRIHQVQRGGSVELQIDSTLPDRGNAFASIELSAADDAGAVRQWVLDPIQPYRWNVRVPELPTGVYVIQAHTSEGPLAGSAAVAVAPEREVAAIGPDKQLMDDIASLSDQAHDRASRISAEAKQPYELWTPLVAAGLLLFLLNVLIRRWPAPKRRSAVAPILMCVAMAQGMAATATARAEEPAPAVPAVSAQPPREAIDVIDAALAASDESQFEALLVKARELTLQRDGGLDALVSYLRRRDDGSLRAARLLASVAREDGDFALARDVLSRATDKWPDDVSSWAELARVEELLGDDAGALTALEAAIEHEHDAGMQFALRVRRASLLYAGEDLQAARDALEKAVTEEPATDATATFGAYLAALHGDNELAIRLLTPAGSEKQQFRAHLSRGLWFLRMDQPEPAIAEFEAAYENAPLIRDRRYALERIVAASRQANRLAALADEWLNDPQLPPQKLAVLVGVLRELGRADEALRFLQRETLTLEQRQLVETPELQHQVIALAVEAGRQAEAESIYAKLIENEPKNVTWRIGLGRLLLLDGRRNEAADTFRSGIERFDDVQTLMSLADGASQLALNDCALEAAKKAARQGNEARVQAVLFEADLARKRGDSDQAMLLLRQLSALADREDGVTLRVAEAFERFGDKQEALRLFQLLYERTQSEDMLLRVAWLLEENNRFAEAAALWKRMWETTAVPGRLRQASERLLDLSAKGGVLADLAIELEDKLAEGNGGPRELSLLVDIYTSVNDAVSAGEILYEFGSQGSDRVETLNRLARVYLSCDQFGRCNSILRRLVEIDPENAADYLSQIAIIAVERERPYDAQVALDELAARSSDQVQADEFSAGVLDMVGRHDEAAVAYGRLLARNPDRIEALLLWGNAMKAAGHADRAVARFQNLVEEADQDDLFAVAIDGLLNLDAQPAALRSALRRTFERIAAEPDKVYLYRLAADVLEGIGGERETGDLLEQAVVVAGERRGALLRELMELAKTEGDNERLIRFGRALIALGGEHPPQVYLDLGEALLKEDRLAEAERVFDLASVEGGFAAIQRRVATCYENADRPADAERVVRQLLVADPDDVELLIRSGNLNVQLGNFDRAFEMHDGAIGILIGRMPARVRQDEAGAVPSGGGDGPGRRGANLDEIAQHFENAATSLLETVRDVPLRERLVATTFERVDTEVAALTRRRELASTISANPRLERLASFARRVAFALHVPDRADRMDEELLGLYPEDAKLKTTVVRSRLDWGLYQRAAKLAEAGGSSDKPITTESLIAELRSDSSLDALLEGTNLDGKAAMQLVPLLLMTGCDTDAGHALRSTKTAGLENLNELAPTMLVAAASIDDAEAVRYWLGLWLDACRRATSGKEIAARLEQCARIAWNYLSADDRAVLVQRIDRIAADLEGDDRLPVDLLRWRLATGTGTPFADFEKLCEAASAEEAIAAPILAELLRAAPADRRPPMVRRMLAARKPAEARDFILDLAGALRFDASEELAETFEMLFRAAPHQRLMRDRVHSQLDRGDWNRNERAPEVGRRIGEVLLGELPNEPAVLVAVAVARETAGRHDEALLLASEALDAVLGAKSPSSQQLVLLTNIFSLLAPDEIDRALEDIEDREIIDGVTPTVLFAKGLALDAADRPDDSANALRAAFEMEPSNRIVSRRLIRSLSTAGREVELSRVLAAHLTRATIMESYEWRTLATLYGSLHDPVAAVRTARKDESPLGPVQVMWAERMMGDEKGLYRTFCRFMSSKRAEGRFYAPFWPDDPSPGGMRAYLDEPLNPYRRRVSLFAALADMPFAENEYAAMLLAAPPDRRDVGNISEGLVRAAGTDGTLQEIVDELIDARQNDALNSKDQSVIIALADDSAVTLPDSLLSVFDDILWHTDPQDTAALDTLARIAKRRGDDDQAARILRWLVAADSRYGYSVIRLEDRLEHIDMLLDAVPDEQRDAQREFALRSLEKTPLDAPDAAIASACLSRWVAAGDTERTGSLVESIQRWARDEEAGLQGRPFAALRTRCAAVEGDFEAFAGELEIVTSRRRGQPIKDETLDCPKLLPPAGAIDQPKQYADAVADAIAESINRHAMSRAAAVQSLSLLGHWCTTNGLSDQAGELVGRARDLAGPLGSHWLWIADLAREAGMHTEAVEIEVRLLESQMLPVPRVAALLSAVEESRGEEAADKLAVEATAFTDLPDVLRRAMRLCQATKNRAAYEEYAARLVAVSGLDLNDPKPN